MCLHVSVGVRDSITVNPLLSGQLGIRGAHNLDLSVSQNTI